jgi:hypothetical protein
MTARVGRLAGAILLESGGAFFLIGNPKEPCDWAQAGFVEPGEIDARARSFMPLMATGAVRIAPPCLRIENAGAGLAELIANRFVIARNGSVSDRLWRLIVKDSAAEIDATWLAGMPDEIWAIVRDTVLKCS